MSSPCSQHCARKSASTDSGEKALDSRWKPRMATFGALLLMKISGSAQALCSV
ncbi:Uncharacterised protein [Bordetella pertussis]|nr:Uncharacterised protein [Bordetella pertussis]CFO09693.1 Uncharacterised protein [Bordetella pertussis]CPL00530.1 Uncharacterised protein [Bordetella pertussis]